MTGASSGEGLTSGGWVDMGDAAHDTRPAASLFDRLFRINAHNKLATEKLKPPPRGDNGHESPGHETVMEPSPKINPYRPQLVPINDAQYVHHPPLSPSGTMPTNGASRADLTDRIRKLIADHSGGPKVKTTSSMATLHVDTQNRQRRQQGGGRRRTMPANPSPNHIVGVPRDNRPGDVGATPAALMWAPRARSEAPPQQVNVKHNMSETDMLKLTKPDPPNRMDRLNQRGGHAQSETYAQAAANQSAPLPRNHNQVTDNSEYNGVLPEEASNACTNLTRASMGSVGSPMESINEGLIDEQQQQLLAYRREQVEAVFGPDERHMRAVVKHSIRMQSSVDKNVVCNPQHMLYDLPEDKIPSETNIRDLYSLRHVLGEGAFAKVHLAVHRLTAVKVAIKVFEKTRITSETARKRVDIEIRNHSKLVHPNIARMYEVMESPRRIYMIMEFGPHGDLHKYVSKRRRLENGVARQIFSEIVKGLYHMHEALCIAHRDIKLENCLLSNYKTVQLVDLGFSTDASKPLKVACGSPSYTAPEIIARQPYDGRKVDMWSLGVILYAMLCGYFPFQGQHNADLGMKIRKGVFRIPEHVTADAADLLRKLLVVDEKTRFNVRNVAAHAWMKGLLDEPDLAARAAEVQSPEYAHPTDPAVLDIMKSVGFSDSFVKASVSKNAHNHVTATYHLLGTKREHVLEPNLSCLKSFSEAQQELTGKGAVQSRQGNARIK